MRFSSTVNYVRSNAITTVDFTISPAATEFAKKILGTPDAENRQRLATALLDELSDCATIDLCNVKVSDTRQYHRRHGGRTVFKQYGYYRPQSRYIYIQNRTAVRGQILAARSFLETLLHEWLHHYDSCALRLNSIHTAGFFLRLRSLKAKLEVAPPYIG